MRRQTRAWHTVLARLPKEIGKSVMSVHFVVFDLTLVIFLCILIVFGIKLPCR